MTTPSHKGNWEMQTFSWEAMYEATKQSSFSKRETDPGRQLALFEIYGR